MALPKPIHCERHMRIACVGAGASGLCFAYKLQRSFDDFELTIYEKNTGLGGVWFENRYPGCACDYEAHNYTFSWEPKADWSSVYATGAEVRQYFQDFADKHGLVRYCKFGHQVTRAQWNDSHGEWCVDVRNGGSNLHATFDILVNACGVLNAWRWPEIDGLDSFMGLRMHSANWSQNVDLKGKDIALIGNGSSGQQLLESLQPIARRLTVFIRQPTWILGPFGETPRNYTQEEILKFKQEPGFLLGKRKRFESRVNSYFGLCLKNSATQLAIRQQLTNSIKEKLTAQQSEDAFVPTYAVGCRRPTPGVKYIESLASSNVELVKGKISHVSCYGVVDHDEVEHKADVLVCATGFDTTHKPRFPIVGLDNKNLQDEWNEKASAYMALAAPNMPNYFVFYGPNNPFASGAFLSTIEAQADYMLKLCDRWQTENIHSFAPKEEAVQDFLAYAAQVLEKTVWSDSCNSWYKTSGDNGAVSLWPGSGLHYIEAISEVRGEDWNFQYRGYRFSWLGDGFSQVEMDPSCDLAYYVRDRDESPRLSRRKRRQALAKGPRIAPESLHTFTKPAEPPTSSARQ